MSQRDEGIAMPGSDPTWGRLHSLLLHLRGDRGGPAPDPRQPRCECIASVLVLFDSQWSFPWILLHFLREQLDIAVILTCHFFIDRVSSKYVVSQLTWMKRNRSQLLGKASFRPETWCGNMALRLSAFPVPFGTQTPDLTLFSWTCIFPESFSQS